jgi:predicted ATP-grasp superfamily ATP-dependent carboligase
MITSSPPPSLPPAVVLGLGCITGLQSARILAGHGVPVIGVAKEPNHFSRTRVCERVIYADTTSDEFIGALETLGPTLDQKAVLVPCTDLTVLLVSRNRQRLERWYHVVMPEADVVELLMHKHSFYEYAQREGFAVPLTLFLESREDAEHAVETLTFPCIMKPTMKTAAWDDQAGAKAYKVATASEFLALYDRTAPLAKIILAQEWISGREGALFSCNCYFDADSKPLVTFVARKLRQWPPQTGTSSLGVECRNDVVLDQTVRLFERVGLRGLGYLEVKCNDRTGEHVIVEPNIGRPTVRGPIAEVGGVDLMFTMYCDTVGLPLPPNREQTYSGAKWIYLEKDILSALHYGRRGELSLSGWAQSMRGPKSDALISLKDPAPFVLGLFRGARILANRVTTRQT